MRKIPNWAAAGMMTVTLSLSIFAQSIPSLTSLSPTSLLPQTGNVPPTTVTLTGSGLSSAIYITGNSVFDGIWFTERCPSSGCTENEVQFGNSPSGSSMGGTLWAPDYWPTLLPFVEQQPATSLEVYECDLHYTFGAKLGDFTTTYWSQNDTDTGGCATWGLLGPDSNYKSALTNLDGQ